MREQFLLVLCPIFLPGLFWTLTLRSCALCHFLTSMCMPVWFVESTFKVFLFDDFFLEIYHKYFLSHQISFLKCLFFITCHIFNLLRTRETLSCLYTQCSGESPCVSEFTDPEVLLPTWQLPDYRLFPWWHHCKHLHAEIIFLKMKSH